MAPKETSPTVRPRPRCFQRIGALILCLWLAYACASCGAASTIFSPCQVDDSAQNDKGLKLPKIVRHTTKNGITVFILQDTRAPIFMQQFWFQVGSANEAEKRPDQDHGTTGLSHFFEHLMFRGTEKHPDYFDAMNRMGAEVNAFTWYDETVYWEKLPSRFLETAVEMEADRIRNLKMDFLNFEPEREVVKSERLLRTDNSVSGKISERVSSLVFQKSTYRWPVVGWMRDLIAITIKEAEAYYAVHYVPNNLFAVFVGDVDPAHVIQLVETHLGDLEPGPLPEPPDLSEPEQTQERRTSILMNNKTAQVEIAYPTPSATDPDWATFAVLDTILSDGRSSLFERDLIYGDTPIATGVGTFLFPLRGRYPYTINVRGLPGTTGFALAERIQHVLDGLMDNPPSDAEIQRAVRKLRGNLVRYMKSVYGRAQTVGFWIRATGDPLRPFKLLEAYGKVTSEDLQRLIRTRLSRSKRTCGFVISPDTVEDLAVKLSAKDPNTKDSVPAILKLLSAGRRLQAMKQEYAMEDTAIQRLKERAVTAAAVYTSQNDTKALEQLDKFNKTAEKGPTKRAERLMVLQKQIATIDGNTKVALEQFKGRSKLPDWMQWIAHTIESGSYQNAPPTMTGPIDLLMVAYTLKIYDGPLANWISAGIAPMQESLKAKTCTPSTACDPGEIAELIALLEALRPMEPAMLTSGGSTP